MGLKLDDNEALPELDGDTPIVKDAEGEPETVLLELIVVLDV